jgi:hypothetical protein
MTSIIETISNTVLFLFLGNPPQSSGTAFVIGYPSAAKPGASIPFIVTARYVIGNNQKILARYSTTDPKTPGLAEYDIQARAPERGSELTIDTALASPDTGCEVIELVSLCRATARYCLTSLAERPIHLQKATISDHGRNKIDNGCKAVERWIVEG